MLNELLHEPNYRAGCDESVSDIIQCYLALNRRYIDEYVRHDSTCKEDFHTGCAVLRHAFNVLMSSTMNLKLTENVCIVTIMYYIEFVSKVCSSRNDDDPSASWSAGTDPAGASTKGAKEERGAQVGMFALLNMCSDNASSPDTPMAPAADTAREDQSQEHVITHRDITLFVYNKTLSNINQHFSKTHRPTERKLACCDYYTRMYLLIVRHAFPISATKTRTMTQREKEDLPRIGQKITGMFNACLSTSISTQCQNMQCMLTLLEYIAMHSSRTSLSYIGVILRLFPVLLQKRQAEMTLTPRTAMVRVSSAEFMYNVRSLSPYAFLKWFVLCEI